MDKKNGNSSSIFSAGYWASAAHMNTLRLCMMAILIAMSVLLARILNVSISDTLRINFGFVPIAVCGMTMGPVCSALAAAAADLMGAVLFPSGPINPFLTLIKLLAGFLYGAFCYRKRIAVWRAAVCMLLVSVICNIILNSAVLMIMYGYGKDAFWVWMTPRIIKNIVQFPVNALIMYGVWRLIARVPGIYTGRLQ